MKYPQIKSRNNKLNSQHLKSEIYELTSQLCSSSTKTDGFPTSCTVRRSKVEGGSELDSV